MTTFQILLSSLLALLVLAGISMMSRVKTAVVGNLLSAFALLVGIVATLLSRQVFSAWTIWPALIVGAWIGSLMARKVKMIQMPQTVALFNGLGGGASALVGLLSVAGVGFSTQQSASFADGSSDVFVRVAALLAVAIGLITLVGSLVAAGKLHRLLPQKPVVWPFHSLFTLLFLLLTVVMIVGSACCSPASFGGIGGRMLIIGIVVCSSCFGLWFALRVGGADMPITISLLNSLSGVAGAIAGMAIGDIFLVAVGGIVGASGLLLTQIMCRAMNRSLVSILTGGGRRKNSIKEPKLSEEMLETEGMTKETEQELINRIMDLEKKIKELEEMVRSLEERVQSLNQQVDALPAASALKEEKEEETPSAAGVLSRAKDVIIVPGYGMALAQAQYQVRQLADKLESRGARVRFAIHPVAGRMPGHMNVLLAEVDIDYEKLFEMEAINDDFAKTDVVLVVGANDVMNPAARNAEGTPIYGMPVLNVDAAPEVIICNYDLKPGYAGVENPLYSREKGVYLELGDAKETLQKLMSEMA